MSEQALELKINCEKCGKTLAYYTGNNYFMALILAGNKHPFVCEDCHKAASKGGN